MLASRLNEVNSNASPIQVFDEKETVRICSTTDAVSRASNHSTSSHHCDGRTQCECVLQFFKKVKTHERSDREREGEENTDRVPCLACGISLQGLSEAAMQRLQYMCAPRADGKLLCPRSCQNDRSNFEDNIPTGNLELFYLCLY
uniref:Uncharacterized protein n=1 Tax=Trichogramma kaykai TaxID=54128 RepID=A0ABD2XGJ9_9HYME